MKRKALWTRSIASAAVIAASLSLASCKSGDSADPSSSGAGQAASTAAPGSASASTSSGQEASTASIDAGYTGPDKQYFTTLPKPAGKASTKFTVGYLDINAGQPVLLAMQKAAQAEVEALGGTFIAKDAQLDPQKQASQLSELIAQKVNVIIGYPVVPDALAPGIAAAKAAGIPFIANDTPADLTGTPVANAVTNVGQAFDYEAYMLMKSLADKNPGATFATMGLALPVTSLVYLGKRMQFWGEHFGLKYLGSVDAQTDTPAGYTPAATAIMTKYPNVKIIAAYNDQSAIAAATAAATSGKSGIVFGDPNSGQSIAKDALMAGRLGVVYRTPWEDMGTQSAIAAYDVVTKQGGTLPKFINVPSYTVDKATAGQRPWIG